VVDEPFGLLNVHKPVGPTSHDIVAGIRRGVGTHRVGHAGTLDPLAEGVLVVALGQATRLVEYLIGSAKTYVAEVQLGIETDTYDAEGEVVNRQQVPAELNVSSIESFLDVFRGEIEQVPPVYSAIKVGGKTAHSRVRAGESIELDARKVTIYRLELLAYSLPIVTLSVECSAGTYIRSLAHDIGQLVGCGASLSSLKRVASGQFRIEESVRWADLQSAFENNGWRQYLLSADLALPETPQVVLNSETRQDIRNGRSIPSEDEPSAFGRAYLEDGTFVAVLIRDRQTKRWHPKKVFSQLF